MRPFVWNPGHLFERKAGSTEKHMRIYIPRKDPTLKCCTALEKLREHKAWISFAPFRAGRVPMMTPGKRIMLERPTTISLCIMVQKCPNTGPAIRFGSDWKAQKNYFGTRWIRFTKTRTINH